MYQQIPYQQTGARERTINVLAQTYHLGTPTRAYKNNAFMILLLGILLICFGILLILGGLVSFTEEPWPGSLAVGFLFAIGGLTFLLVGLSWLRTGWRHRRAQLYLCSDGFLHVKGVQVHAARWDQITTIQKTFSMFYIRGVRIDILKRYHLECSDGRSLILENVFRKFKEAGMRIEQQVTTSLFPAALGAFQAGQFLSFGSLRVNNQGIFSEKEQKMLEWADLKRVYVRKGQLVVSKTGSLLPWKSMKVSEVPNLCLLVALVSHATGGEKIVAFPKQVYDPFLAPKPAG